MFIKNIYSITVVMMIICFFVKPGHSQTAGKTFKQLSIVKSVPSVDNPGLIFGRPVDITINSAKDIFIIDIQSSQIFKLNEQGILQKTIGRRGGGPGEFFNPIALCCNDSVIATYEIGVKRIQFFDFNGEYLSSFKTMVDPYPVAMTENTIAGVVVKRTEKYSKFINIFNFDGKKISEFGDVLEYDNFLVNRALLKIFNERLYVAFRFHPELRVYSLGGELLSENFFEEMAYADIVKSNYDPSNYKIINMKFNLNIFFDGMVVNEAGVFLCYPQDIKSRKGVVIDHFSHEGKFITRYQCDELKDVADFEILGLPEGFVFYIIGYSLDDIPVMAICREN